MTDQEAVDFEAGDFASLCAAVKDTLGVRLEYYRSRQLLRRLEYFKQRHRLSSYRDLADRLKQDPTLKDHFADFLTINVSEFFRNPDRWKALAERHLPALLRKPGPLSVWSAGCSIGAEIFTVALLLRQLAPGRPARLLGTDLDEGSLERAREGVYQPGEVREVPDMLKKRHFRETPAGWELDLSIRGLVEFRRHDLLTDPFPEEMDLIICRNVVIYFTDDAKALLFRKFNASLRLGGLLFIGSTESIFNAAKLGFRYVEPCFYEKVAAI